MESTYLLFDLDGTLTDSAEGITKSVCHALAAFGIESQPEKELRFIGPPLADSFKQFYGFDDEQAAHAVEAYRAYFAPVGIFENKLYDGIPHLLETLTRKGYKLAVASSKPAVFVEKILDHFGISSYFTEVVGSELDGRRTNKAEVIAEVMKRLDFQPEDGCMIGDRSHDIEGAHKVGMMAVGATWGFGSREELQAAKADLIADSPASLEVFF